MSKHLISGTMDSEEIRRNYYALFLSIVKGYRPEQAFARLKNQCEPRVTVQDLDDIIAMRKCGYDYDEQDREIPVIGRVDYWDIAQMYGVPEGYIQRLVWQRISNRSNSNRMAKDPDYKTKVYAKAKEKTKIRYQEIKQDPEKNKKLSEYNKGYKKQKAKLAAKAELGEKHGI
jgi:hypothetical protein